VPASSSQATPVLPTAPCRPISPCRTSPRGCSAFLPRALPSRKNARPRAPPTNVASISPRHLSEFVTSQLLRAGGNLWKPAGTPGVETLRGVSHSLAAFRRAPTSCPKVQHQTQQPGHGSILPGPLGLGPTTPNDGVSGSWMVQMVGVIVLALGLLGCSTPPPGNIIGCAASCSSGRQYRR
jgi:hypothetical protein